MKTLAQFLAECIDSKACKICGCKEGNLRDINILHKVVQEGIKAYEAGCGEFGGCSKCELEGKEKCIDPGREGKIGKRFGCVAYIPALRIKETV